MNNGDLRQQILWELFESSNRFLQDIKVDYWVDFGTLLGFYRENDIIAHDIDIDYGCHEKHYPYILNNLDKLPAELTMHDTSNRHNGPKLYMSYKGFDADIYFYREEEGQLFSTEETDWENYNSPSPKDLVFPTKDFEIRGLQTRIPDKTEAYLKTIYGCLDKDAVRNPETGYWEKP
ncbi:MAG: LicD family protein [Gracilimonas sp.]|uniref:LicD family protein n=1 Tax=Gracilimonas TaxID=649462 RepID=UPI001B273597|nr:LicD family protein [Gracilimonas sp.]MBO6584713.1 LicD family protein [Gracilimonas sp.]MBO6616016.1 LicD family protein [Gracilimonas sp.]